MPIPLAMAKRKIKYPEVGRRISELIRIAFEERGARKADIARAVKKDWTTVYIWSRGMAMPRPENLTDLASALDTTPEYIQHGITSDRGPVKQQPPVDVECEKKLDDYRRMIDTLMRQNDSLQKQVDGLQTELRMARDECARIRETPPLTMPAGAAK